MRAAMLLPVAALIAGCASRGVDYNLDYAARSASLYVEAPDGSLVSPLEGATLAIDGTVALGPQALRIPPGQHWIRGVHCPAPLVDDEADGRLARIESPHGFGTGHLFEIGKAYLLRCVDGYPEIVPYEPAHE